MKNPYEKERFAAGQSGSAESGGGNTAAGLNSESGSDESVQGKGAEDLSEGKDSAPEESKQGIDAASDRQTRRQGIVVMSIALGIMLVILIIIGVQLMKVASDPETLEAWLEGWGTWGVFVFMALVILQILAAVVPGGPFEVAAGYLYGPLKGAIICDIAMTAGSVLVFLLVRKIGMRFVRMFFSQEEIDSVRWLQTSDKKNLVLFIVFLIPGMPKDLLSYAVGLTDIRLGTWVFITAVGRFPAILLSTISGSALENDNYILFIVVMAVLAVAMVVGGIIYKKRTGSSQ